MSKFIEKAKEMYKYINVTIDKEFALQLIPIVELVITDGSAIKKIAKQDVSFVKRLYIKHCDKKDIQTHLYNKIIEDSIAMVRYKVLVLLDALYDIINEDTPKWNNKWNIKPLYKVKYNEIKTTMLGFESFLLEPKPEYMENVKRNKKIQKHNEKRRKICQKWRNSSIDFYKKMLKIVKD